MKSFEILKSTLNIHQNYFLEASAGTGKTFAIEHLFVRLLIEEKDKHPVILPEILVVTFTKAATIELQARIRKNIERTLRLLEEEVLPEDAPDYLYPFFNDPIKRKRSLQLVQEALFCFDDAKIFTLHGFCACVIQENPFIIDTPLSLPKSSSYLMKGRVIVKDFLRKMEPYKEFGPQQFEILLKKYYYNLDDLLIGVLSLLAKRLLIDKQPTFFEMFQTFKKELSLLKERYTFVCDVLSEELIALSVNFSGLTDRKKQLKKEFELKLVKLAQIFTSGPSETTFDELICGLYEPLTHFQEEFRLKSFKGKIELPSYPHFLEDLHQKITPLIEKAGDSERLIVQFASLLQHWVEHNFKEEEELFYDDLLSTVAAKVKDRDFCRILNKQYKAVIIDEFQDTDPLQWTIFSSLFDQRNGFEGTLSVVGDPKQSIYSFRNADIYTYLEAQKNFSIDEMARLDINYRSEPQLIESLNALFSLGKSAPLFKLPKKNLSLSYIPVNADFNKKNREWKDGRKALHFFILRETKRSQSFPSKEIEEELLFPAILNEIILIHSSEGIPLKEMAILVKDRYQADRFQKIADCSRIPLKKYRGHSLIYSEGVYWIKTWLNAVLEIDHSGLFYKILRSPFFGFTHEDILSSQEGEMGRERKIGWRLWLLSLKDCLSKGGLLVFIQSILRQNPFESISCPQENLFKSERRDLYSELIYLSEYLTEKMNEKKNGLSTIKEILQFIDEVVESSKEEEHLFQTIEADSVNILTQHMSKGLEFSIVFALGVSSRSPRIEGTITDHHSQKMVLKKDNQPLFDLFCEELDAEKVRQFYVALTRAKSRLYIPFVIDEQNKRPTNGTASPFESFLRTVFPQSDEPAKVFKDWLYNEIHPYSISYSEIKKESLLCYQQKQNYQLDSPKSLKLSFSPLMIQSFTSVKQPLNDEFGSVFIERENSGLYNLPRGSEFGIFLHALFEKVSFSHLVSGSKDALLKFVEKTAFEPYKEEIVKLLYNTFHTPLSPCQFTLSDIDPQKTYKEMEFLFLDKERHFLETEGLFKGFIDLFFSHEGLYYLLDWKSNDLGQEENYAPHLLNETLKANEYHLQANIYTEALNRYLKMVDPRPFNEIFGGVFYLFLRGLNPKNKGYGVAFWKP